MTYVNSSDIAILMAVYNGGRYIEEQIESVIGQTAQNWTLYIRDDNSTDNTLLVIEKFVSRYKNIVLISDRCGRLGARNNFFRLLELVDSRYYMFCDADDVWLPEKVHWTFSKLKELECGNEDLPIIVHTDCSVHDTSMVMTHPSYWDSIRVNPDRFLSFNEFAICACVGGAKMMFNSPVKKLVFPLHQNDLMFDAWITLCVLGKGIVFALKRPTMKYRIHNANVRGIAVARRFGIDAILAKIQANIRQYRRLRTINYGPVWKYLYYKAKVLYKLRHR